MLKNSSGVPSLASWIRIGTVGSIQPGTIQGIVTAAARSAPIAGATVSVSGQTGTTDTSGHYSLAGIPAGDVQVTVEALGFATETRQVSVGAGQASTLDVAMAEPVRSPGSSPTRVLACRWPV